MKSELIPEKKSCRGEARESPRRDCNLRRRPGWGLVRHAQPGRRCAPPPMSGPPRPAPPPPYVSPLPASPAHTRLPPTRGFSGWRPGWRMRSGGLTGPAPDPGGPQAPGRLPWSLPRQVLIVPRNGRAPSRCAFKDDYHHGDETVIWPRPVPVPEPKRVN